MRQVLPPFSKLGGLAGFAAQPSKTGDYKIKPLCRKLLVYRLLQLSKFFVQSAHTPLVVKNSDV